MTTSTPLFAPTLIPPPTTPLPPGYTIRPLTRTDHAKGYFDCLRTLTWVGANPTAQQFEAQYDWLATKGAEWFYNVVIEFEGQIVGSGVVIVERKLYCVPNPPFPFPFPPPFHPLKASLTPEGKPSIHDFGKVGHIEDISISSSHQGKGLGRLLILALSGVARNVGCYKCILDCGPQNEKFYEKCGYAKAGTEMSLYFEKGRSEYERG
jgi:glucosamine-phosphate N-acetyltransferase